MEANLKDDLEEDLEEYEDEIEPWSLLRKIVIGTVSTVVLLSFTLWAGGFNLLRYNTTPPIVEDVFESKVNQETFMVPINVLVYRNSENLGSERDEENIRRLVDNASNILAQADIGLELKSIHRVQKTDEEIGFLLDNTSQIPIQISEYDRDSINMILSYRLRGINGLAISGIHTIMVADVTTVYDFRATAHEVGHILGLSHTDESRNRLMFRGANGSDLTEWEIEIMRTYAKRLF